MVLRDGRLAVAVVAATTLAAACAAGPDAPTPVTAPIVHAPDSTAGHTAASSTQSLGIRLAAQLESATVGDDDRSAVGNSVSPEAAAAATDFVTAYLSYDYRLAGDRLPSLLQATTTPELVAALSTPLPDRLVDQLAQDRRVDVATVIAVLPVEDTPGRLHVGAEVTTTSVEGTSVAMRGIDLILTPTTAGWTVSGLAS